MGGVQDRPTALSNRDIGDGTDGEAESKSSRRDTQSSAEKIRATTIKVVPGHFPGGYPDKPLPAAEQPPRFPHPVMTSQPERDHTTLMITGASIATAGLTIGLALGWLIWG